MKNLTWYERQVLKFNQTMSLKQISKRSGISYKSLLKTKNKK